MSVSGDTSSIQAVVERAATDPDFLKRLAQDPAGTAEAEGITISPADVKKLLDMPDATDEEAVEALQARLSHSGNTLPGGGGAGLTQAYP